MNKSTLSIIKKSIASALMFAVGFGTAYTLQGNKAQESTKQVTQTKQAIQTQTAEQKELVTVKGQLTDTTNFYMEDGDQVYELSNGSWYLINNETNTYIFQAVELGDWDYTVENKEQLMKLVNTYISMKNTGKF